MGSIKKRITLQINQLPAIEASHSHGSPPPASAVDTAPIPTCSGSTATTFLEPDRTENLPSIVTIVDTTCCVRGRSGHFEGNMGWSASRCTEEEDVTYEKATPADGR